MNREKIIDKIQKCLALSKSPNENEAATALRQAQKLMSRHGITELEIGIIGYGFESVETAIQAGKKGNLPVNLGCIVGLVAYAFGVTSVCLSEVRQSDYCWTIRYYGPQHRALLAKYAHTVIARAIESGWKQYQQNNPALKGGKGFRDGYYYGWIKAIRNQLIEFAMTEEEETAVNSVLRKEFGGEMGTIEGSRQRVSGFSMNAGMNDGKDFRLHQPVEAQKQCLEKL